MLERRVSPTPHDAMLDRWRSRVALRSSPPTTSAPEIPTAPIPPAPSAVDIPIGRLYRTYPGGPCRSSSDHSSSGHSILCHFVFGHTPLVTTITDSSALLRFVYPPLARTPQYRDAYRHWRSSSLSTLYPPRTYVSLVGDSSFESSVEPSRKRCRSHVSIVTSSIHTSRALVPSRAYFLPPRKRFKDSILPEDTVGEEIDTYVLADIKADAMVVDVVADMGVEAMVNVGIGMEVDVGVDVKDEVEGEVESSDRGIIKVGVDVVARIDIPDGKLMPDAIKCLEQALATYEANRAAKLVVESQSQNGDDDNNSNIGGSGNKNEGGNGDGNDGGNGNKNGGGNGNGNPNRNDIGVMPVSRECTYHDFVKCQPLDFKGTEGVIGLTRWFEKIEMVFHINNCPKMYQVKYARWNAHKRTIRADAAFSMSWIEHMKLMTEVCCLRNEIQKKESELWNLTVKNDDLAAYTRRFQELTMMCTKMVLEEEDQVEKFIRGLPDNIQENVIAAEPTRLQDVVRIANNLMDQKLKGYAVKNAENKKRLDNNQKDNRVNYNKVGFMARDCINAVVATATRRAPVVNQRVPTCFECGRQGHYMNECPKFKNQTRGNKTGKKTNKARGKAYMLGGGEANPDSNIVTGTFLLNNHYAFMLFGSGVDRSFVLSTFSALLYITPSTLDVSYAVELADERVAKTNIVLRGYILGLLGHPFNIDLMPIELGSFDVLIVMDWNYNKVGFMARDCINAVVATATRRAPVVNQRVPTCFECGRQGHYMNECPKFKNQTRGNKTGKKTNKARGKAYMLGGGEANPDSNI
nr:hypothetical protein [Tanacetum cinerariifolium]